MVSILSFASKRASFVANCRGVQKPKSATVRDLELMRLLRSYDDPSDKVLLEDIPENEEFQLGNKRFVKKEKLRKRYRCELVGTGRVYLVSAIAEVEV